MKKNHVMLSVLLILILVILPSCSSKQESNQPENGLEPIPEIPTYEGTSVADSPFVGSFKCSWSALEHSSTDDPSWEGRISTFVCNEDGTFILMFNSLEDIGSVSVSGTIDVKDDIATCTIKERSSTSYLGSDLDSFQLKLINENELRYKGDQQGLVADRDIFTKEG